MVKKLECSSLLIISAKGGSWPYFLNIGKGGND
jgi:hypothetical protein